MSRWGRLFILVMACVGACQNLASAEAEKFHSVDQMPGMINQDAATVNIANIGTVALSILYLDGTWKTVEIPSGQFITLPSRSGSLSVSFNDGAEAKSVTLNPDTTYALYWNSEVSRWGIAPYDDVARRPGAFRSQ
jgi:hypothetical protein